MKILIVCPRFYPEAFSINAIAKELANRGNNLTVLTGRPLYGLESYYAGYEEYEKYQTYGDIKIIRVNTKTCKGGKLNKLFSYLDSNHLFKKELRKLDEKFDIVLSIALSPLFSIAYTGKYCRKNKIPNFLYGLDIWPDSFIAGGILKRDTLGFNIMKKYSQKLYQNFDHISYSSPSALNYIKNYLGVNKPMTHIYQPSVNACPTEDVVSNHEYKKDGKLHLLYCGTTAYFTHLDLLLRSLLLCNNKDKIIVDIVGSGHDDQKLAQLQKDLHLENVHLIGRVPPEETVKYYQEADILFVPLYHDSYTSDMIPQKVIEYLKYSRPVFGMLKGDGKILLQEASSGNVFADQTSDDIALKLDELIIHPIEQLDAIGKQNRKYYLENKKLHLEYAVTQMISIMESLIKERK